MLLRKNSILCLYKSIAIAVLITFSCQNTVWAIGDNRRSNLSCTHKLAPNSVFSDGKFEETIAVIKKYLGDGCSQPGKKISEAVSEDSGRRTGSSRKNEIFGLNSQLSTLLLVLYVFLLPVFSAGCFGGGTVPVTEVSAPVDGQETNAPDVKTERHSMESNGSRKSKHKIPTTLQEILDTRDLDPQEKLNTAWEIIRDMYPDIYEEYHDVPVVLDPNLLDAAGTTNVDEIYKTGEALKIQVSLPWLEGTIPGQNRKSAFFLAIIIRHEIEHIIDCGGVEDIFDWWIMKHIALFETEDNAAVIEEEFLNGYIDKYKIDGVDKNLYRVKLRDFRYSAMQFEAKVKLIIEDTILLATGAIFLFLLRLLIKRIAVSIIRGDSQQGTPSKRIRYGDQRQVKRKKKGFFGLIRGIFNSGKQRNRKQRVRKRKRNTRSRAGRGYSGLSDSFEHSPYRDMIRNIINRAVKERHLIQTVSYTGRRFTGKKFVNEKTQGKTGIIGTKASNILNNNIRMPKYLEKLLGQAEEDDGFCILFIEGLDNAVRDEALKKSLITENEKDRVYGSHYGILRNQIYLDAGLLDPANERELVRHLVHELKERQSVIRELEKIEGVSGVNWRSDYLAEKEGRKGQKPLTEYINEIAIRMHYSILAEEYPSELIRKLNNLGCSIPAYLQLFESIGRYYIHNIWHEDHEMFLNGIRLINDMGLIRVSGQLRVVELFKQVGFSHIGPIWTEYTTSFNRVLFYILQMGIDEETDSLNVLELFREIGIDYIGPSWKNNPREFANALSRICSIQETGKRQQVTAAVIVHAIKKIETLENYIGPAWVKDPVSFAEALLIFNKMGWSLVKRWKGKRKLEAVSVIQILEQEEAIKGMLEPAFVNDVLSFAKIIEDIYRIELMYDIKIIEKFRDLDILNLAGRALGYNIKDLARTLRQIRHFGLNEEYLWANWQAALQALEIFLQRKTIADIVQIIPREMVPLFKIEALRTFMDNVSPEAVEKILAEKYRFIIKSLAVYDRYLTSIGIEVEVVRENRNELPLGEIMLICSLLGVNMGDDTSVPIEYAPLPVRHYSMMDQYFKLFSETDLIPNGDMCSMHVSVVYDIANERKAVPAIEMIADIVNLLYCPEERTGQGKAIERVIKKRRDYTDINEKDTVNQDKKQGNMERVEIRGMAFRMSERYHSDAVRAVNLLYSCFNAGLIDEDARDSVETQLADLWTEFVDKYNKLMHYEGSNLDPTLEAVDYPFDIKQYREKHKNDTMKGLDKLVNTTLKKIDEIIEGVVSRETISVFSCEKELFVYSAVCELLNGLISPNNNLRLASVQGLRKIIKAKPEFIDETLVNILFTWLFDLNTEPDSSCGLFLAEIFNLTSNKTLAGCIFDRLSAGCSLPDVADRNRRRVCFEGILEIARITTDDAFKRSIISRSDLFNQDNINLFFEIIEQSFQEVFDERLDTPAVHNRRNAYVQNLIFILNSTEDPALLKYIIETFIEEFYFSQNDTVSITTDILSKTALGVNDKETAKKIIDALITRIENPSAIPKRQHSPEVEEILSLLAEIDSSRLLNEWTVKFEYAYCVRAIGRIASNSNDIQLSKYAAEKLFRVYEITADSEIQMGCAGLIRRIAETKPHLFDSGIKVPDIDLEASDSGVSLHIVRDIFDEEPDDSAAGNTVSASLRKVQARTVIKQLLTEKLVRNSLPQEQTVLDLSDIAAEETFNYKLLQRIKGYVVEKNGPFALKDEDLSNGLRLVYAFIVEGKKKDFSEFLLRLRDITDYKQKIELINLGNILFAAGGFDDFVKITGNQNLSISEIISELVTVFKRAIGVERDLRERIRNGWDGIENLLQIAVIHPVLAEDIIDKIIVTMRFLRQGIGEDAGFRMPRNIENRLPRLISYLEAILGQENINFLLKRRLVEAFPFVESGVIDNLRNRAVEMAGATIGQPDSRAGLAGRIRERIHNNPSPHDLKIAQNYLRFVESDGTDGGMELEKHGYSIADSDIVSPNRKETVVSACRVLINALEEVYGGGTLASLQDTFMRWRRVSTLTDNSLIENIEEIITRIAVEEYSLKDLYAITQARYALMQLKQEGAAIYRALLLDSRLEMLFYRVFNSLSSKDKSSPEALYALLVNALTNGCDASILVPIIAEFKEFIGKPIQDKHTNLRLYSILKRIERLIQRASTEAINEFQKLAEITARAIGVSSEEMIWVETFTTKIFRADTIHLLALVLPGMKKTAMDKAEISGWQVIVPGNAYGKLRYIDDISKINEVESDDIVVLRELPDSVPPIDNVKGIITLTEDSLLSHPAIRARQVNIPYFICPDFGILEPYLNKEVKVESCDGTVSITEITAAEDAGVFAAADRQEKHSIAVLEPQKQAEIIVLPKDYRPETVGNKAYRLSKIRANLSKKQNTARHAAIPFGVLDKVLNSDINAETGSRFSSLLENISDPSTSLNEAECRQKLLQIRKLIQSLKIPKNILTEISSQIQKHIGSKLVFLRSSTNVEDLSGYAAAGLYNSYGAVDPANLKELEMYIKKVWASLYSDNAFLDRKKYGIENGLVDMSILVQDMIPADYSFVIHTQNPANESDEQVIVDIVQGLGESLVNGEDKYRGLPHSFTYNRTMGEVKRLSYANKDYKVALDGNKLADEVADYSRDIFTRNTAIAMEIIRDIARASFMTEQEFNYSPQDIEGCITLNEETNLYAFTFVQSRDQQVNGIYQKERKRGPGFSTEIDRSL